eukprot:scaffold11631_cov143-Skeletonema_marinoi.AAC.3
MYHRDGWEEKKSVCRLSSHQQRYWRMGLRLRVEDENGVGNVDIDVFFRAKAYLYMLTELSYGSQD